MMDAEFFKSEGGVMVAQGEGGEPVWDFGWADLPEVRRETGDWLRNAGKPLAFADAAPHLIAEDDNAPLFFWDAEEALLGKVLDSWDQGQVGSCVSMGWGRGAQDLLLWEIHAGGESEQWPGAEVCREAIYGGSRVEVGGGRIRGDGSTGGWAAKWVKEWGVLLYQEYQAGGKTFDLTDGYSVRRCREWGDRGCPNELESVAREHPVREVALVSTEAEGWAAIGAGKPVPICSNVGFQSPLDSDGYCARSGTWNHCMLGRGRFVHPKRGKSVVVQNSWADYVKSRGRKVRYVLANGGEAEFTLPAGCFCATLAVFGQILAQRESYAAAGLTGWQRNRVDHTP